MIVFALAILAALGDVVGGLIPFYSKSANFSPRYILAFASGVVVAAAFFELLPEANIEANWLYLGLGFFILYLVEKGLELHTCGERECEARGISWITAIGMASDNIIDGIGIGVGFLINPALGVIITLAVIAHEIPQGMTTTIIMKQSGFKFKHILTMLIIAGAMYPLGAAIGSFIPQSFQQKAIAFVAGVFIYVGAGALMSEAHKRFNIGVVAFMIFGGLVALGLKFLE